MEEGGKGMQWLGQAASVIQSTCEKWETGARKWPEAYRPISLPYTAAEKTVSNKEGQRLSSDLHMYITACACTHKYTPHTSSSLRLPTTATHTPKLLHRDADPATPKVPGPVKQSPRIPLTANNLVRAWTHFPAAQIQVTP